MIGFMQGRLTESKNGKIQFFPWNNWENEFQVAYDNSFELIEWTIDIENIDNNPIYKQQEKILDLKKKYNIEISSVTCDFLMEAPYYKDDQITNIDINKSHTFLNHTIKACNDLSIKYIIFPLVDEGKIENEYQKQKLIRSLNSNNNLLNSSCEILFETDFNPKKQKDFMHNFSSEKFGINYDTGNSASLGFSVEEEFQYYYNYIKNIHIKDRKKSLPTTKLGNGDFNFKYFFDYLTENKYDKNLILQTARSEANDLDTILYGYKFIRKYANGF